MTTERYDEGVRTALAFVRACETNDFDAAQAVGEQVPVNVLTTGLAVIASKLAEQLAVAQETTTDDVWRRVDEWTEQM